MVYVLPHVVLLHVVTDRGDYLDYLWLFNISSYLQQFLLPLKLDLRPELLYGV